MLAWRGMWRYRDFRRGNYAVTVVWAAALLLEAAGKALVIHAVGFDAAYVWTQVLPWVATAVALVLTVLVARHYARA
ncbi:MAG: hypothetical protein J0H43_03665, partial [Actinobacteria bacterium]|nr:hypothetical protein [Actinomycetota bacterium]